MKKFKIESLGSHKKKIEREKEIKQKIKDYKKAQKKQLDSGGPGLVADYDIMAIVNQYNDDFEITAGEPIEAEIIPEGSVNG